MDKIKRMMIHEQQLPPNKPLLQAIVLPPFLFHHHYTLKLKVCYCFEYKKVKVSKIILKGWSAMSLPTNFFINNPELKAFSDSCSPLPDCDERSKTAEHNDRLNFSEKAQKSKENKENLS